MRIMLPARKIASPTQPFTETISLVNLFGIANAATTPINSAVTGCPTRLITSLKLPLPKGIIGRSEMDFSKIKTIGRMMGRSDLNTLGASFNLSSIPSSVNSSSGSMCIFDATLIENSHPTTTAGIDAKNPNIIVKPKSAPKIPAAATGPGVGGIVCVA